MADTPSFRQEGTELPKGSGQELDAALEVASSGPGTQFAGEDERPVDLDRLAAGLESEALRQDDYSAEFFAPSDFPDRPVTHGASFGPGANEVRTPRMSDRAYLARIATRIVERKDQVTDDALVFAMRVLMEG